MTGILSIEQMLPSERRELVARERRFPTEWRDSNRTAICMFPSFLLAGYIVNTCRKFASAAEGLQRSSRRRQVFSEFHFVLQGLACAERF